MIYLLDTNAWVAYLRRNNTRLIDRLHQTNEGAIRLCSVVLAELIYGAHRSGPSHVASNLSLIGMLRSRFISLHFDDSAAEHWGDIRAELASIGNLIGPNDLAIASIARAHSVTVVTHNTTEFRRVPGLDVEDWK